ncbi:MAG: SPASM domain-containing protein [Carboxylicivirga sp.]|jgi:radical SAM protein with 4Fe4S-binding SPASM domain|nr:SPASM domain-containing protein [Carboxylicivirga sp.]
MVIRAFFIEAWAIFNALTWCRMINALKITSSYLISYFTKKVRLSGFPMAFSIEPTSICNLQCPECPTGANLLKRPRGMIGISHYRDLLDQLAGKLIYLNLYVQGEPLMHPEFADLVKIATSHKLYTSTSTNGHFMNQTLATNLVKNGLKRLIFSVDGTSQESYGLYRVGGQFEKVKSSIEQVVAAKKEAGSLYPLVVMQFLVFQHNEHEVPEIKKLARSLNVDKLEIKTAQLNHFGTMRPPINARYSRYADELGQILKRKERNRCWRQWHSATSTWDGNIAPCCYDKDADYAMGNAVNHDFDKIWHGSKSINFKDQILKNRSQINICSNCPEGKHLF